MTAFDGSTTLAVTTLSVALFVVLYVWVALALAAVFQKSGEEGWRAWVPILNLVVLLRLGGLSGWLLLMGLVPFLGVLAVWVVVVIACHRIGAAFGFGPGMTVLAALLLPVWASIIGFGTSRWVGAEAQTGVRRSSADIADDGLAYLAALSEPDRHATFDALPPMPAYGLPPAAAEPLPPQPPLPAAPAAGWAPPPLPPAPASASASAPPPASASAAGPVSASAPPPVPPMPRFDAAADDPWEGLPPGDELTGEVTGAVPGAPSPISAVPATGDAFADEEVPPGPLRRSAAAESPPVTRVPAAPPSADPGEPWAPARSPMSDPEAFPDTSGPVSAIAGAPVAGTPRAARSSVSAVEPRPGIPDEPIEETIITQRRRTRWSLIPPSGAAIALNADVVILGRRPVADAAFPGAQLVAIQDGTVSKTHARLELRDETWYITDLDSTNGILFATLMGTEVEAPPGVEVEAGDRFLLGDAEVRLSRSEA